MGKGLFVGLVIGFSVFIFCAGTTRSEAASPSSASVNKEIDASNIGFKSVQKIASPESDGPAHNVHFAGNFAYSPDGRYLLYTPAPPRRQGNQIFIVDVATRKITKVFTVEQLIHSAWSPDGQRISTCYGNMYSYGLDIYEIKSGKHTKVKVDEQNFCSNEGLSLWYMNEKILFGSDNGYHVFDLDSLSDTKIPTEEAGKIIQKLQPNSLGKAHFFIGNERDGNGTIWQYLGISNNDESFGKVLVDKGVAVYALSPKYDSIAFSHSDGLFLAYLDTNVKTEMNYSVDSFRDSLPDDMKGAYTSLMSRGELLVGEVYAPKINPLNGKVVGYEGEAKGKVKIIGESNGKVVVQKIFERTPFKVGKDVLSNIKAGEFHLNIWPTLHSISEKELGPLLEGAKKDQKKQKEAVRAAAKEWVDKGTKSINAGDKQGAFEAFSKAIELDANYARGYVGRGYAYAKKGQFDEAIKDYNKAISLNPDNSDTYSYRGFAYMANDKFGEAIEDYNKAISLNPDNAYAYHFRGVTYGRKGQYDRAIEDFNKEISLDSNNADAYFDRGFVNNMKGQYDKAIEDYSKAISLKPDFAGAYFNRGAAYQKKGQNNKAIADFKKVCELGDSDGCNNVKVLEGKLPPFFYKK